MTDPVAHNLSLRIEAASGEVALDVRTFTVQAEMNRPYQIDVSAMSSDPAIDLDSWIGVPATFEIRAGMRTALDAPPEGEDGVRRWTGIVSEARAVASEEEGLSTYRVQIVPRLWLLSQRTNIRIFQHLSELEVAIRILDSWEIPTTLRVDREAHRRREYRTQYEETDFDFVNRMFEEAGISYYFESNFGQSGRMIITDAPNRERRRPRALTFQDSPMAAQGMEWASGIELVRRMAPGRVALVDHDFRRPPEVPIVATAQDGLETEQRLEMFDYRDGHFLFVQGDAGDPEDPGDQRGPARTDDREAQNLAQKRIRSIRARAKETSFRTNAYDVDIGDVVPIENHARTELAEQGLLITELVLTGGATGDWQLDAIGTSAAEIYRPPLRTPRPVASGVESATVVGPDPNKSHKDRHGRIFVHFHWDRDEFADEYTTCWMHVSQPWSGANYGGGMMPRPGQEVIVAFFGSDPDRPIVVGRYHTAIQQPLFRYPSPDEEGGITTWSDDGGGGQNMIRWVDRGGQELLRFQAQRDRTSLVKRNSATTVRVDQSNAVGNNRTIHVRGDETRRIDGQRGISVGKSQCTGIQEHSVTQTMTGAIIEQAATAHVTTAQGTMQEAQHIQRFVVGGSSIVISPEVIMINAPKVVINPGPGQARSIMETGRTLEDRWEDYRIAQMDTIMDRRSEAISAMPPGPEQSRAWQAFDRDMEALDARRQASTRFQARTFGARLNPGGQRLIGPEGQNRAPLNPQQMGTFQGRPLG